MNGQDRCHNHAKRLSQFFHFIICKEVKLINEIMDYYPSMLPYSKLLAQIIKKTLFDIVYIFQ